MKKISPKLKLASAIIGLSCFIATSSYAADANNMTANNSGKTQDSKILASSKSDKFIQNFKNNNLSVQFRYSGGKLVSMRLMNTGKDVIKVHVFQAMYVLGPDDYVVLNPANKASVHLYHGPLHSNLHTAVTQVLPHRFTKEKR